MKIKRYICISAAICFLVVSAFLGFRIYSYYANVGNQTDALERIAAEVDKARGREQNIETITGSDVAILIEYRELFEQNSDMVGWIQIEGTTVNYPVMKTPDNPDFYIDHNFDKQYSSLGVPYIQENCDLETSGNIIIYGHHIKGRKLFGALEDYKSESFYDEHKIICFDTLTEHAEYEIVAVFKTVAYSDGGFKYHEYVVLGDEDVFDEYVAACKELSLYDTGVIAEYGDKLITLSTCEYSSTDGRLVVVAKKL